jgi:hypothetical protein
MGSQRDEIPLVTREDLKPDYKGLRVYRTLLSLDGGGLRGLIT